MVLTAENYYSQEANEEYMSVSQFKDFCGTYGKMPCEFTAMEKLKGRWEEPKSKALMVGSYVDSYFEGTLDKFKAENPDLFKRDGTLKAEFVKADEIIQRIERDDYFMKFMSGKKQVIMTGELFGTKWNVKVTVSYLKSKGLIEVLGADEILLTQCAEMVGSETDAARRKRLQRDRERNRAIGSDPVPALEEKSEVVVEEKPAKKKAENTIQLFHRLVEDYNISEPVREKMEVWFRYKMERKESYKEQGMKSLLKKTENNEGSYGANEICNLIEDCMANNWKGIIWKILEERKQQRPATRTEQIQQRVSEVDSW